MDQDVKDRLDEQLDFIKSRASKEDTSHELDNLRKAFYWVIGVMAVAALSVIGTGLSYTTSLGKMEGRVIRIETQLDGLGERQKENNDILQAIEELLREGH